VTTKTPRHAGLLLTAAVFLCALLPRAMIGRFLTVDEAYHWFGRVERFGEALAERDWAATNLIGHPGVTTLWLGAAGTWLHQNLIAFGLIAPDDLDAQRTLLRLPIAIVTAGCVALAYLVLRRLFARHVALLAALLMAGEPFLVAHSQLLHLDALLTSFMTVSVLTAIVADTRNREPRTENQEPRAEDRGPRSKDDGPRTTDHRRQTEDQELRATDEGAPFVDGLWPLVGSRWWLVSAVFGGLALLTKSPAIFLLPMIGLIALVGSLQVPRGHPAFSALTSSALQRFAFWCLVAALVWFALWPAAWVDPLGAIGRVVLQASADGGAPHGWGNFFLGRAVADPGPLFYPVTLAFRLAPWTVIGLVGYCGFWIWDFGLRRRPLNGQAAPLLLALFVVGFCVALSLSPKKFDRYALPVFPALDVLAALGLVRLADALRTRSRKQKTIAARRPTMIASWGLVVGLLALNLALPFPYHLAYFNPLLGGGPVAARVVPVGWGEGYEQAGAFVASRYNGADRPTAARYEPVLNPFVPAGAAPLAWWQTPGRVDYAVVYIDQIQRDEKPETFRPLLEQLQPIHTVRINGIDYAYVFQIPPPVATPLAADFGEALHLRGYALDTSAARASNTLTLTLEWQARAAPTTDYVLFVHVFDEQGRRVANVDVPAGDVRAPTSTWRPGQFVSLVQPVPLPPELPAGIYRIAIGVYDPATGARLPLRAEGGDAIPEAGAEALALARFELP
jgi:4-amino-4-deoxy-L-arabinose transferase-like glycosyltransferase